MKRPPVAVLDTCVLVPMPLADTLLRLAESPALFDAKWTDEILAEMTGVLIRRFAKTPARARYRAEAMRTYFPHAIVDGYQPLVSQMPNHPKDRHVLAAAIACKADYLVTFNLRDFPSDVAGEHTLVVGPSAFLKILWRADGSALKSRLQEQAAAIGFELEELLDRLAYSVPAFVDLLRKQE